MFEAGSSPCLSRYRQLSYNGVRCGRMREVVAGVVSVHIAWNVAGLGVGDKELFTVERVLQKTSTTRI